MSTHFADFPPSEEQLPTEAEQINATPSVEPSAPTADFRRWPANLLAWLPSVLTFALLATIAWYGHRHEWKLPAAKTLTTETGRGAVV